MARRKLKDRMVRKITRIGGYSLGITLPIDMVQELGWREKQKVTVTKIGRKIIIRDWS
tara:strand:- start:561 stop:734 length:174 start_codon:yes stop_codon:yes gene_type:complete